MSDTMSNLALAHWAELCDGGGERVAWELARGLNAPLYVGYRDESIEPGDVEVRELFDGRLRQLVGSGGLTQMAVNQIAWETPAQLRGADTLVTSGNEPLAYVPPEDQTWVHYCHHTSRYATDLLPEALDQHQGRLARVKKPAEQLVRKAERLLKSHYASKPDLFVANSELVARRMTRYWGVEPDRVRVVYPPVPVDEYSPGKAETGDYYLSLCRLDSHKGLGQVVRAFNQLNRGGDYPLKIAGTGCEEERLKALAGDNVEFLGFVPEEEKAELMAGAKAFIVNAHAEDFGITTVEALASGTPVLGVREGMTEHLIVDGASGHTYPREGGHLRETVRWFDRHGVEWSEERIARFADRFRPERFHAEMREAIDEARERARVTVEWEDLEATAEPELVRADGGER